MIETDDLPRQHGDYFLKDGNYSLDTYCQNTTTLGSGLSDFHKMILTVLKATFQMVQPKETIYRKFKNSELNKFKKDVRTEVQSVNNYETFEEGFPKVLNNHAPLKKKFVPANIVSYMTKVLRKANIKLS